MIFAWIRERVVDLDEGVPLVRQGVLGEDRLHRALRFARAAIYALLGVDDQHPLEHVDAIDRADIDAREVFDVDAGLGDDVRHDVESRCTPRELRDELGRALDERRLHDHLVETGRVCSLQARAIGVVREAHERHVGPLVGDLFRLDARDVRDHEIRGIDAVDGDEVVLREKPFQLAPEEEVDPCKQDRRHVPDTSTRQGPWILEIWDSNAGSS